MANSTSHTLPFPVKNARFTLPLSFRVAAGTPTDPTTPDTEFSTDGGATFGDCAEEITTGGTNGFGYLTLSGAETNNNVVLIAAKSANCVTTPAIVVPRNLPILSSGTASAGAAGTITLGTVLAYDIVGCIIRTTGGTGGGGVGGANNQARVVTAYNTGTGAATVVPNWETTPDATTTYDVLLTDMCVNSPVTRGLRPTTDGRTLDVTATGAAGVDWANVENQSTTVNLTGTTSLADVVKLLGTAWLTPAVAGTPDVNTKLINGVATTSVTAINANVGTTQPVNFTGTGATAYVKAGLWDILGTVLTETAGQIAAAFVKFFNKAAPTGTVNSLPDAVPGAANGLVIAGSNAATTFSGLTTGALSCSTITASGAVAFQSTFAVTTSTNLAALSCTTVTASGAVALQSTVTVTGTTTFAGIAATSINVTNSAGSALSLNSTGANGHGLYVAGNGGGDGAHFVGGGTGHGLHTKGGSTSGDGIHAAAQTLGDGIDAVGAGGGVDIRGDVTGDITGSLSGSAGSVTAGVAVATNNDKSGYSISGTTTTLDALQTALNSAHGSGSWATATGFSTHSAADVWTSITRTLTAGTNIVLAKGTGVTGFNDIAATAVVSGGAITTSGGAVTTVTTTANVSTVNGLAAGVITESSIATPAEASGRPTGILGMIRRMFEWDHNKRTRDRSTGTVLLRNAADSATLETQTQSTTGTTDSQTQGV